MLKKPSNNGPTISVDLTLTAPDQCIACGWKPPKDPGKSDMWINILQNGPISLLGCPKCLGVMMNKDFRANIEKIEDAKSRRIVEVSSPLLSNPGRAR